MIGGGGVNSNIFHIWMEFLITQVVLSNIQKGHRIGEKTPIIYDASPLPKTELTFFFVVAYSTIRCI